MSIIDWNLSFYQNTQLLKYLIKMVRTKEAMKYTKYAIANHMISSEEKSQME